jgi:hypothetical protein
LLLQEIDWNFIQALPQSAFRVDLRWHTSPPALTYYYPNFEDIKDRVQSETLCSRIDKYSNYQCEYSFIRGKYCMFRSWGSGECVFARKPPEPVDCFGKPPDFLEWHSKLEYQEIEKLLISYRSNQVLAEYRSPKVSGFGKLVDFQQPIGLYRNPTTRDEVATTKGMIYYGKKGTYILPAAPNQDWFVTLQEQFQKNGWSIDFQTHITREVYRALIGKVIPQLKDVQLHLDKLPYLLELSIQGVVAEEDFEMLECVWFEVMAGLPQDYQLDFCINHIW